MAKNSKYAAIFLKEAGDHLTSLIQGVIALESATGDQPLVHELMRNAHTIKGAARSGLQPDRCCFPPAGGYFQGG